MTTAKWRLLAEVAPTAPLTGPLAAKKGLIACPKPPSGSGCAVLGLASNGVARSEGSVGMVSGTVAGVVTGTSTGPG